MLVNHQIILYDDFKTKIKWGGVIQDIDQHIETVSILTWNTILRKPTFYFKICDDIGCNTYF